MWVIIYAIAVTVIAIILAIKAIKWKVAFRAMSLFCLENFRKPTDKEIADCSKRAVSRMMGVKE